MLDSEKSYTLPRIIICEGYEDFCFFSAFIEIQNLPFYHVATTAKNRSDRGGQDNFGNKIVSILVNRTSSVLEKMVLVVDSDNDPAAAFESVASQVNNAGLTAPTHPGQFGAGTPSVCIITMPMGGPGNLESCLVEAARVPDAALSAFVDHFVENVTTSDDWTGPRKDKLTLRALLSAGWPRDPGINLGQLIKHHLACRRVPLEHPSLHWLRDLLV